MVEANADETNFTAFFWELLETVPEPERGLLKKTEKRLGFIPQPLPSVDYAGTLGGAIVFCLPRLQDKKHSIVEVIYHELAHCLLFERGSHDPLIFQTHHELVRDRYEGDVRRLEKSWTSRLAKDETDMKRLGASKQLAAIAPLYSYAPLVVANEVR